MKKGDIRSFFQIRNRNSKQTSIDADSSEVGPIPGTSREGEENYSSGSGMAKFSQSVREVPVLKRIGNVPETSSTSETHKNDSSDLGTLDSGPAQPIIDFPKTQCKTQRRAFQCNHYKEYKWLEYSIRNDKVYCYYCRLFGLELKGQNEKFSVTGYNKWKKLSEDLQKHSKSQNHCKSVEKYTMYKASLHINVQEMLNIRHNTEIQENREYVLKLIEIILHLTRQGNALRGHREGDDSKNKGNFLELCDLFAKFDEKFADFLQKKKYLSHDIQNEIICISSGIILNKEIDEINQCGFYSLMVDEARCYKSEQLSVVVRYSKGLEIEERFLGFIDCSSCRDASGLENLIMSFLQDLKLKVPIVAQSYDGASVMAGKNAGLQAKIKASHPQAIYTHCMAHRINLIVVDTCKSVAGAAQFFNAVEALYCHYSKPGAHKTFELIHQKLGLKPTEIQNLSTTRWSCRFQNCDNLIKNFSAIKQCLEQEISDAKDHDSVEAMGILSSLLKAEFVVSLFVFHFILSITHPLSEVFQNPNATLGKASQIITSTISLLKDERNSFSKLWSKMVKFADDNTLCLEPVRMSRKRKTPQALSDFVVESSVGHEETILGANVEEHWRVSVFLRAMDAVTNQFVERFGDLDFAKSIDSFLNLSFEGGNTFIHHYSQLFKVDIPLLKAEIKITKQMVKKEDSTEFSILKKYVTPDVQPNLYKLFQIAIAIPVSSAGCERSFSAMRRIKTWLRSCMDQDRFSQLSILHIENELAKDIDSQEVLNIFAKKNRKMVLI